VFFFRSKHRGHEVFRSTTAACGARRVRRFAAETPDVEPGVVVGNAPAWPVQSGVSSFGDAGSDFEHVWRDKRFYADHTGYLRLLDDRSYVLFVRPQRFGKTLWLSTMEAYYDVRFADSPEKIQANEPCFSTLFGGVENRVVNESRRLAIARDESRNVALQNSFYVLKLELLTTYFQKSHEAEFRKSINDQVRNFLKLHPEVVNASDFSDVLSFVDEDS